MSTYSKCVCVCKGCRLHSKICESNRNYNTKIASTRNDRFNSYNIGNDDLYYNQYETITQLSFENPFETNCKPPEFTENFKDNKKCKSPLDCTKKDTRNCREKLKGNERNCSEKMKCIESKPTKKLKEHKSCNPVFKISKCTIKSKVTAESTKVPQVHDYSIPKYFVKFTSDSSIKENTSNKTNKHTLNSPKPNHLKMLEKQMKRVQSLKVDNYDDCFKLNDDHVVKQVNFPADQKIYKNLIMLNKTEKKRPSSTSIRNYQSREREMEPRLENFFNPEISNEYSSDARITFPPLEPMEHYDGYDMYRRMRSWDRLNE